MDERLEKALAFSNYRITIENQRRAIMRRFETMLVVHYQNGMFLADKETIAFVEALLRSGNKDAIVLDQKNIPVDITNLEDFLKTLTTKYFEAVNEYSTEYKKLAKARNVKKAMNW